MIAHTPRPWAVNGECIRNGGPSINVMAGPYLIASVPFSTRQADNESRLIEAQANARLIAAAPELVLSLQATLRALEGQPSPAECLDDHWIDKTIRAARAAITKAKGETI